MVRDKKGNVKRFPLFENEIGEVILKSGNMVSTGALASLGFWDVDVLIMTQRGRPVAMLKGLSIKRWRCLPRNLPSFFKLKSKWPR